MAEDGDTPLASGPPKSLAPSTTEDSPKVSEQIDVDDAAEAFFAKSRAERAAASKQDTSAEASSKDTPSEASKQPGPTTSLSPTPGPDGQKLLKVIAESAAMQGRRPKQEDRHVKIPDLTKAAKALKMPIDHLDQPCSLFAVYDGHQGHQCSEFVAKNFHVKLLKRLSADTNSSTWTDEKISSTLTEICEELDTEFLSKFRTSPDGTTLVAALITGTRLFTAWVGDSRLVLCQRAEREQQIALSITKDHRPWYEMYKKTDGSTSMRPNSEAKRVVDAGGMVVDFDGVYRVAHTGYKERILEIRRAAAQGLGVIAKEPVALAVSRALGDRDFKAVTGKALLIPTPCVKCTRLDRTHKFLLLMCDGISEVMRDSEVCDEIERKRPGPPDPVQRARMACGALVQEAYKKGSEDNLTVILVRLEWEGGFTAAPLPPDHPVLVAEAKAAETKSAGDSAVVASKKRRLEAAASVSKQKVAAYERAVSEAAKPAISTSKAPTRGKSEPDKSEAKPAEEKPAEASADDDDDGMTFL